MVAPRFMMEELLSQAEAEDEDLEENDEYRTLDGGYYNG